MTARILSATVSRDSAGRWFCSFQAIVRAKQRPAHAARSAYPVVGVDVGVKVDSLLVVATPEGGEIARVPAPKSLSAPQARLRVLQRRAARQHGPYDQRTRTRRRPSKRGRRTQARIGKTHARAVNVRRDVLHKATTSLAQQHQVISVESLNASGMRAAGGAFKRGLSGVVIDRDLNAAINLARLGETHTLGEQSPADSGSVAGRGATRETEPARAGNAGGREASTPHNPARVDQTGIAVPQETAA